MTSPNQTQALKVTKEINVSEVAATTVIFGSGFFFCRYLLITKATNMLAVDARTAPELARITSSAEALTFFIVLIACVASLIVTVYHASLLAGLSKCGSLINGYGKKGRQLIALIGASFAIAVTASQSAYGLLLTLFVLFVLLISSKKVTDLAVFSISFLAISSVCTFFILHTIS